MNYLQFAEELASTFIKCDTLYCTTVDEIIDTISFYLYSNDVSFDRTSFADSIREIIAQAKLKKGGY